MDRHNWKNNLIQRAKLDPVWWIENVLGERLWSKQRIIAHELANNERVAVPASFGCGKTFLAARIVLWFLYNFRPSKVISTAPTSRQVKDLLWSELRKAHAKAKMPLGGSPLQLSLTIEENHYAVGFATDDANYDSFTGYHSPNQLVIFDQAGGIPNITWEAAEGLMTSNFRRWLAIGNTAISDGAFADICMPERKSSYGTWKIVPITAEETPNVKAGKNIYPGLVSHDWVAQRRKQWGEDDPLYRIFVKAQFVPGVQMVVVPFEFLDHGYDSYGEEDIEEEIEIGLDVARTGLDSTVWFARSGEQALEVQSTNGNDTMTVVGMTIEFIRQVERRYKKRVRVVKVDIIGIGAGVYDRLVEQDIPTVAINNAAVEPVVDKERYSNVRAEMAWAFRHRFEHRSVGLRRIKEKQPEVFELLQRDIQVQKYEITSAGKILLWSKEKIKKELGRSPDYWDAAVMAYEEPGGGPAAVDFLSGTATNDQVKPSDFFFTVTNEEWLRLLGENVDINDPSFIPLH